jgi:hypothetical protein
MEILPSRIPHGGPGQRLLFEAPEENDWEALIGTHYVDATDDGVKVLQPVGPAPRHVRLPCQFGVSVPNIVQFEEFSPPCDSVSGKRVDPLTHRVHFKPGTKPPCYVDVGFGDDGVATAVQLADEEGVTVSGVDRWRCNADGSDCGCDKSFEKLSNDLLEARAPQFVVDSLGAPASEIGNYADLDVEPDPFRDLHGFAELTTVVAIVGAGLASAVVVGVVVGAAIWLFRRRKSSEDDAAVAIP